MFSSEGAGPVVAGVWRWWRGLCVGGLACERCRVCVGVGCVGCRCGVGAVCFAFVSSCSAVLLRLLWLLLRVAGFRCLPLACCVVALLVSRPVLCLCRVCRALARVVFWACLQGFSGPGIFRVSVVLGFHSSVISWTKSFSPLFRSSQVAPH